MDIAKISYIGNRDANEDYIGVTEKDDKTCLVLADGLGGHGFGEVASRIAVNAILEQFQKDSKKEDGFLINAVNYAQQRLNAAQENDFRFKNMRTTVTLVFISRGKAQWLHVGDSRIYMFRGGRLLSVTADHSIPGALFRSGKIKFTQIRGHEDRNKLLRVLGQPGEQVEFDLSAPLELIACDAFLLCSDGFWECIDEKHMERCLRKAKSADDWLKRMYVIVNKNGKKVKMDNNSAIVALYQDKPHA